MLTFNDMWSSWFLSLYNGHRGVIGGCDVAYVFVRGHVVDCGDDGSANLYFIRQVPDKECSYDK